MGALAYRTAGPLVCGKRPKTQKLYKIARTCALELQNQIASLTTFYHKNDDIKQVDVSAESYPVRFKASNYIKYPRPGWRGAADDRWRAASGRPADNGRQLAGSRRVAGGGPASGRSASLATGGGQDVPKRSGQPIWEDLAVPKRSSRPIGGKRINAKRWW